ncbi:hypothetical protein OC846_001209 [Tilletia horrida]|uniref:Serine hydrolase domain-containing protein n=1 Tax=Tilletia horrida TaxID=155126 RepID=A0AAN6GZC9_9BASI|nr:hypothetical protein OC845_000239 [Tilletia horrida]KAK0556386.1 hypothetical protein OC846_001209 [Tilletia horrida]KAK0569286.1 hypothetical protein OC861_001101 [Tilletia horrida]
MTAPLRILALHGYTSNAFIFNKRLGAIRRACRDVAEFHCINGPHLVQPFSAAQSLDAPEESEGKKVDENTPLEEQPRAWWKADDDGNYLLWPETVEFLNGVFEKEGPFDAVCGFSQGACLAGILASAFEDPSRVPGLRLPANQRPFRFGIAISGFRSRDPSMDKVWAQPIQTPMLVVLGKNDLIVDADRAQTLTDVCANVRVEEHEGGHSVPTKAAWRNFFRDYLTVFSSANDGKVDEAAWRQVPGPADRQSEADAADDNSGKNTPKM